MARWIDNTKKILAFERENSNRCHRIRYEELVQNPIASLKPMFEFLDVEWEDSLLDSVFSTEHDPGDGDLKVRFATQIYKSSIGKGSTINFIRIPEQLLKEMNALLEDIDYPVVGTDWDTLPSPYVTMASVSEQSQVSSGVEDLFTNYLPRRIQESKEMLKGDNRIVCKIELTGNGGGSWIIDSTKPENQVMKSDGDTDCVVKISSADLLDIINGKLNLAEAYMQDKLHVTGDDAQLQLLGKLLIPV